MVLRAKGHWQRSLEMDLRSGLKIPATAAQIVKGKARHYLGRYQSSLVNLIIHLEYLGHKVVYTPGPRGGRWKGTYHIEED